MLQNPISEDHSIDISRLFNNARVGDSHDNPVEVVMEGVTQGESHPRPGFPSPGGNREPEDSLDGACCLQARLVDLVADLVEPITLPPSELGLIGLKTIPQLEQGWCSASPEGTLAIEVGL